MQLYDKFTWRFASLLHDIGKFWQGAGGKGKHEELSSKFIQQFLPMEIQQNLTFVEGHHNPEQYLGEEYYPLKILVLADWIASSERRNLEEEEEKGKREKIPMESIFSNISLNDKKMENMETKFYEVASLHYENFPRKEANKEIKGEYRRLWDEFIEELKKIKYRDKETYFVSLYYLLKKYTSFIPSAVWMSKPDISLFDHSKITCAIAECIYKNGMEENEIKQILQALNKNSRSEEITEHERELLNKKRFMLIGGDISGIQKFIYSITAKGAAKGLKGRSLYLQLLSEAIAKYILRELDLSIANLIYSAGGHFYIIAPMIENIEEINQEIESIILEIHNGELYVAIDKVELSINDFIEKRLGEKWKELANKLGEKKKKKFSNILDKGFFIPSIDSKNVCQVCGLPSKYELIEEKEEEITTKKCRLCKSFEKLTEKIAGKDKIKANYIVECEPDGNEEEGTWEWNIAKFGVKYNILRDVKDIKCKSGIIYTVNRDDFIKNIDGDFAFGFKFIFQTPLKELEDLAKSATGIKRWGVLKGDVDNLGRIFSNGLKKEYRSLSRISTLSSLMSLFFSKYISNIYMTEKFKEKIYGVYSGGDDFFIIGSWDILPELAHKIYEEFREYTGWNPDITLSIGISLAPSIKYPIYRIAEIAEEELDKAKSIGKDALSFLGIPFKWNEYSKIVDFRDKLRRFLENAPRGSLQKLYSVYLLYEKAKNKVGKDVAKYDNRHGKWRWMLAYLIARMNVKIKEKEEIRALMIDHIDYSPLVIRWVEYLTRGGR